MQDGFEWFMQVMVMLDSFAVMCWWRYASLDFLFEGIFHIAVASFLWLRFEYFIYFLMLHICCYMWFHSHFMLRPEPAKWNLFSLSPSSTELIYINDILYMLSEKAIGWKNDEKGNIGCLHMLFKTAHCLKLHIVFFVLH